MLSTSYHMLCKLSKITHEPLLLSWRECGSTGNFYAYFEATSLKETILARDQVNWL